MIITDSYVLELYCGIAGARIFETSKSRGIPREFFEDIKAGYTDRLHNLIPDSGDRFQIGEVILYDVDDYVTRWEMYNRLFGDKN